MKMCNDVESKIEYDRMHFQLSQFLRLKRTESNLGTKCVSTMIVFSESLVEKELYLANYTRHTITNCMDSATTSPMESQNSIVHQKLDINFRCQVDCREFSTNDHRPLQLGTTHLEPNQQGFKITHKRLYCIKESTYCWSILWCLQYFLSCTDNCKFIVVLEFWKS